MAPKTRKAAVTRMAIGSRTEFVINYYSEFMEDLQGLMEAPLEFMRGQQFLFEQDAKNSVPWLLLGPVDVVIECGYKDLNMVFTALNALDPGKVELNTDPSSPQWQQQLVDLALEDLKDCFYVEYATYTNGMRVIYFPSDEWMKSATTVPVEKLVTEINLTMHGNFGNVHFDLIDSSQRGRADFILNCMKESGYVARLLNEAMTKTYAKQKANGAYESGLFRYLINEKFVDQGKKISTQEPRDPTKVHVPPVTPLGMTFTSNPVVSSCPAAVADRLEKYYSMKMILAAGLSDPHETIGCGTLNVTQVGKTLHLGDTVIESYLHCLYNAIAFIKQVANS